MALEPAVGIVLRNCGRATQVFTPAGELVPAPKEAAIQEQQRAEAERQRAEQAEAIAERLRHRLEEMGVDPRELQ